MRAFFYVFLILVFITAKESVKGIGPFFVLRKELANAKEKSEHLEEVVAEKTRDLVKSEEKIKSIFVASLDGVAVTDLNGIIIDCNEQALKIYGGLSREELIGKSPLEFIAEKDRQKAMEDIKTVLEQWSLRNVEYTFLTKDGHEFQAELSASIVLDASGNPISIVEIFKDITERKRMEQQLLRSERLAAIGELAEMVGHDLRNPLTGIAGAAYYLKKRTGSKADKKTKEMLEFIEKDVEYSNNIITDLLEYSREIRLELMETTPKALMKEALSMIKLPHNIQILDSTMNKPKIMIDIDKMKRVFVNLIKNAVEAMPKGGTLTITSKESDGDLEVAVADTGVGMTKEVMDKLWTPLFTTKAKGMGLGLSICKRIVEAHEGNISVESTVGEGTIFTVTIPKLTIEGGENVWENQQESSLSTIMRA
jgi:PAS domain S-box-containing protein